MRAPAAKVLKVSEVLNAEDIHLSFPSDFLASSSAEQGVMTHAQKLLFPAAKQRLGNLDVGIAMD